MAMTTSPSSSKQRTTKPSRGSAGGGRTVAPEGGPVSSDRYASFTAPGLSSEDGVAVVEILQRRLCAMVDLGLTLKHIHWNVVGPSFVGVHEMLDPQYAGVQEMVDTLAERIATMGGVPSGLPGRLVEMRTWDDYDLGRADTQAHLGALDVVYRGVIADHRQAMEEVGDIDPVTEDILIEQTGILEQYHWFVRSHLEDWAGGLANAGAETELEAARAAVTRSRNANGRGGASRGTDPDRSNGRPSARRSSSAPPEQRARRG